MAKITLTQEAVNPAAPASTRWHLFFKSGGLYIEDSSGNVIGPLAAGLSDAPSNGTLYGRLNAAWSAALADAPSDGSTYGRLNAAWVALLTAASTATLTNKRLTPRVTTITSSATPTINTDNCDVVDITAQAVDITSMTSGLSGAPTNFQTLVIRIKGTGARAIAWGAKFEALGVALPATTVTTKRLLVGLMYDATSALWGCVAVNNEA